jgi:regulatory protein
VVRATPAARREERANVTDPDVVMEAAAALLAARPRTVAETRRRLRSSGYPSALVDRTVDRLVELGLLDDGAFARAWVDSRDRARPRGMATLRRELGRQGVPDDAARTVLAERADARPNADAEAASRLLEKRAAALAREPDPRKRRQKAYALLARNGFDPDVCREIAASVGATADEPDSDPPCAN